MTDEQSFEDIAFLLNLYPGVSFANVIRCEDDHIRIRFRCHSIESLKKIVDCAVGANVGIKIGPPDVRWSEEPEGFEDLCFYIQIQNDWTDYAPPSRSQIFGVFLARNLKATGGLAADRFVTLQKGWNAVPY